MDHDQQLVSRRLSSCAVAVFDSTSVDHFSVEVAVLQRPDQGLRIVLVFHDGDSCFLFFKADLNVPYPR